MFLLRAAFWLTLVLFLIPADPAAGSRAGVLEAIVAARGAIADMAAMCDRQPDVCANGGAALQAFGERARTGAAMLSRTLDQTLARDGKQTAGRDGAGTLDPTDLLPVWRDPAGGGKA